MKLKIMILNAFFSIICLSIASPLFAADTEHYTLDSFFQKIDLYKLTKQYKVQNLMAQMEDLTASTDNVDDFKDFIAITSWKKLGGGTSFTEFNLKQKKVRPPRHEDESWMGSDFFSQKEINKKKLNKIGLQDGFNKVRVCMARKGILLSKQMTRVVIYKSVRSQEIIYDYVFIDPNLMTGVCQEAIYSPVTGECDLGMRVDCHVDFFNPTRKY